MYLILLIADSEPHLPSSETAATPVGRERTPPVEPKQPPPAQEGGWDDEGWEDKDWGDMDVSKGYIPAGVQGVCCLFNASVSCDGDMRKWNMLLKEK